MSSSPNFDVYNEATVRGEIIDPLLRLLGYSAGTENDIIRERSLRYPRFSLGRKDGKRDPELRGRADYILSPGRTVRWVIEAKPATDDLGIDSIEQAWTYANHPEVRAVYYSVCNGRRLLVFRTQDLPDQPPLLDLQNDEFKSQFERIARVVGPAAMIRDFPVVQPDFGMPLAPGLRSFARIVGGAFRYEKLSVSSTPLQQLQFAVREGAVERLEDQSLLAWIRIQHPMLMIQELNDKLGISSSEWRCADSILSTDPTLPTVFTQAVDVLLPAGETLPDINTWKQFCLPIAVNCQTRAQAAGAIVDGSFVGKFSGSIRYIEFGLQVDMSGPFELKIG